MTSLGEQWAAPVYLGISPICSHIVLLYYHQNPIQPSYHQMSHIILAMLAFAIGGIGAIMILHLPADKHTVYAFPFISGGLCIGVCDLMIILPKGVVARVISCTVCAVLVVVLACFTMVSTLPIAYECYKSTCVPLLYLVWQSTPITTVGVHFDTTLDNV
jgi:hypothetical protein